MTNTSIETQPVLINLALAVADCLEMPTLPESLRDSLNEVGAALADELTPNITFQLRALALAHPESETPVVANPERKAMALNA